MWKGLVIKMKKSMKTKKEKKKLSGFKKFLIIYPTVFVVIMVIILILLNGLLKDFEASEPDNKMNEVVKEMTTDNIESLIKESDINLTEFESIDVIVDFFKEKMKDKDISYKRKSGEFRPASPVYQILAGESPIAKVKLESDGKNSHKFTTWKLGEITFNDYIEVGNEISILAPSNAVVKLNGIEVNESYKVGEDTVVAETKNIGEYADIVYMSKYNIEGLVVEPEVTVELSGVKLDIVKDKNTFTSKFSTDESLLAEQKDYIINIMEHYGKYIINRGNLSKLLSYTVGKAHTYLSDIPAVWAYLYGMTYTYEFRNESVTNLIKYSEDCFSVEVYFDLYVDYTKGNNTNKTSMTYIFVKKDNAWVLADFIQHQVEEN